MTTPQGPRKRLPNNPSEENLRKQAKRLATQEDLQLAAAQRRLAIEYGYKNWAELMRAAASRFIPLVPLRGLVAFPHEVYPIYIGRRRSLKAVEAAEDPKSQISLAANSPILLVAQREAAVATPSPADMYEVGTLGVIAERHRLPDGTAKIIVEGKKRARIRRFVFDQKFFKAEAEDIAETSDRSVRVEKLVLAVLSAFHKHARHERTTIPELATRMRQIEEDPSILSYLIARHLDIEVAEQQALLECVNPVERLEKILGIMKAE